ncbi:tetratricopeptide repeat protein [Paraferrimonas sp. SM1919]|uniref:tetratricopeptide repeat protein n=1 Tax=Paraferrimonas sp. SM1919 TaxID=2662263 RepID=UPI0013D29A32|nr:SEL1-like repeat protein [Paraferrimonas sp. SM1919]
MRIIFVFLAIFSCYSFAEMRPIEIYSHSQLLQLIRSGKELQQVRLDDCQLTRDIEARAKVMQRPPFQYLYSRMLLTGTCTNKNVLMGIKLMSSAAEQGLPEAMIKLAHYYRDSDFVSKDPSKSRIYIRLASSSGSLEAQLLWAKWSLQDQGKGWQQDYLNIYKLLNQRVFNSQSEKQQVDAVLKQLRQNIPTALVSGG